MKMKTNKIGSYLAVTAGAGCVSSVASGVERPSAMVGYLVRINQASIALSKGFALPDFVATGQVMFNYFLPQRLNPFYGIWMDFWEKASRMVLIIGWRFEIPKIGSAGFRFHS